MAVAPVPNHLKVQVDYRDQLSRLNELAPLRGWREALAEVFSSDPSMIEYATNPARWRFLDYLPLSPQSTVLEIGPGLGQITVNLAPRVGFLHAVEVEPGQVGFIQHRCRQEGVTNVSVVPGGADCLLPHDDSMFDGIVINNVIEWCGGRNEGVSLQESQRILLREMNRVLKPGGWLYLMTKNRFGWRYLMGKPDEHTYNWRFGQAIPRPLLSLLLRLKGKSRPVGLIHSYSGLRRMLIEAGFGDLQPWWPVPDLRVPTELIPLEPSALREARKRPDLVQGDSRLSRFLVPLLPASAIKYVTPGLVFLARKPA